MDVLRRMKALRRRPEKFLEDSLLTSDIGALHLHRPAWYYKSSGSPEYWYGSENPGRGSSHNQPRLLSCEDLDDLNLAFFAKNFAKSKSRPHLPEDIKEEDAEDCEEEKEEEEPQKGLGLLKAAVPRISVTRGSSLADLKVNLKRRGRGGNGTGGSGGSGNEVYRSNSFRFERCDDVVDKRRRQPQQQHHNQRNKHNDQVGRVDPY